MFTIQTAGEISLETFEPEIDLFVDSELPDAKGELLSHGKTYSLTYKESPKDSEKELFQHIRACRTKSQGKKESQVTPIRLAAQIYQESKSAASPTPHKQPNQATPLPSKNSQAPILQQKETLLTRPDNLERARMRSEKSVSKCERKMEKQNTASPLAGRSVLKEETQRWWEARYHQKREGREEREQRDHHEEKDRGSEKKKGVKPILERPRTGIFALYHILTKIGIYSDGMANFSYKQEIETVNGETTEAHKMRLEALKIAMEKEASSSRWSVAAQVFSLIGSLIGIAAGIALIATGVGAVAGALMIAGGIIQICNQILEVSGGWKKIAEILPGNDPDKKRAVISWIQIGIAVLCLILSGIGVVFGGGIQVAETSSSLSTTLISTCSMTGQGVTSIGEGVTLFMFNNKMSDVKRYDKVLAELKHKRQDLMERVEWGIDRLEQLFEDLSQALEFEEELFRADQMVNR